MIRYSKLPPIEIRDFSHIHHCDLRGVNGVAYPFQLSYSSYLHSAVDMREKQREKAYTKERGSPVIPDGALPYLAWHLNAGEILDVWFLRRVNRIAGDAAILELNEGGSRSHMVLYGESMKQNLNEGIDDFVVNRPLISAGLHRIIDEWVSYEALVVPERTAENRHAPLRFMTEQIKPVDPAPIIQKYLFPIERGERNMWREREYYPSSIRWPDAAPCSTQKQVGVGALSAPKPPGG